MEYYECEKLKDKNLEVVAISQFLEHSGYVLCKYSGEEGSFGSFLIPTHKSIQDVVYEYLDIDAKRLEEERDHMLKSIGLGS